MATLCSNLKYLQDTGDSTCIERRLFDQCIYFLMLFTRRCHKIVEQHTQDKTATATVLAVGSQGS